VARKIVHRSARVSEIAAFASSRPIRPRRRAFRNALVISMGNWSELAKLIPPSKPSSMSSRAWGAYSSVGTCHFTVTPLLSSRWFLRFGIILSAKHAIPAFVAFPLVFLYDFSHSYMSWNLVLQNAL